LTRLKSGDDGTFGKIDVENTLFCTAELPSRGNKQDQSSIPAGVYKVSPQKSQKFGDCYRLNDVPNRTGILIHAGNYAGDISKGYRSDVKGCIIIGDSFETLHNQQIVANSRESFERFKSIIGRRSFMMAVEDVV
jgi:hypothetical protein